MASAETRARRERPIGLKAALIALSVATAALPLASCDLVSGGDRVKGAEPRGCPRPGELAGRSEFNEQEVQIRELRKKGFGNDFFAQLELAQRYGGERATDKNLEDAIESAVWYALALSNPEGYTPTVGAERAGFGAKAVGTRYDRCRADERKNAYKELNDALTLMSTEERQAVRDRVIYVLSTMEAEGFRTLARIHDVNYGPYGEPRDNPEGMAAAGRARARGDRGAAAQSAATSLFTRNDVDAYLYNALAVRTGDVSAYVLLRDFERSNPDRQQTGRVVEAKVKRWVPPFEFYPPESPARLERGVPHSDESRLRSDAQQAALEELHKLPFVHVGRSMRYLGIVQTAPVDAKELTSTQVKTLQGMLGRHQSGDLEPIERVRAVQMAAVRGSADSQLVLAVMYAEGIGVPADYARAYYWFDQASRQGSAEATYAMSEYFALGLSGVADQDKAMAVTLRLQSALDGFRPSASRLQSVKSQITRSPRR